MIEIIFFYLKKKKKKSTHISISLNGGANLLRAGCDSELCFALQAFIQSLFGHRGGAAHVFIAGVCAAANETCKSEKQKQFKKIFSF